MSLIAGGIWLQVRGCSLSRLDSQVRVDLGHVFMGGACLTQYGALSDLGRLGREPHHLRHRGTHKFAGEGSGVAHRLRKEGVYLGVSESDSIGSAAGSLLAVVCFKGLRLEMEIQLATVFNDFGDRNVSQYRVISHVDSTECLALCTLNGIAGSAPVLLRYQPLAVIMEVAKVNDRLFPACCPCRPSAAS